MVKYFFMLIIVMFNFIFSSPSLGGMALYLVGYDDLVSNIPECLNKARFITISNHCD